MYITGYRTTYMSYALLNYIFANYLNLIPGQLVYFGHDVHVYESHLNVINEQLLRIPKSSPPKLIINKKLNSLEDILSLNYENDVRLLNYECYPALPKIDMIV